MTDLPRVPMHLPLVPRVGQVLRVLVIARISTKNQNVLSLEDQIALSQRWIQDRYTGKIEWLVIKSRASGERLDRSESREAEDHVAGGKVDLVITEDLARIFRRSQAYEFCEFCEDHDTRLIAINDNVDTADDWHVHAWFATFKGEMHNRDTSKRIKRTMDNRFHGGGTLSCLIYGYEKPPGAKSDEQLRKRPEAEAVYDRMFMMAEQGAGYSEIADWLNGQGVPTGPTCQLDHWNGPMVGRIMHNPILKGVRERGRRTTRRHNQTGQHRSVKAGPDNLKQRMCPHLAFIEPTRYDRVIRQLDARNARYRRKGDRDTGKSSTTNGPRKRSVWPDQALVCGVCGRPMIHQGLAEHRMLMCQGATLYRCWNSLCLNADVAAEKLTEAMMQTIEDLSDFDEGFRDLVQQRAGQARLAIRQKIALLLDRKKRIEQSLERLLNFVCEGGDQSQALARQQRLQADLADAEAELAVIEQQQDQPLELPPIAELKAAALEVLQGKSRTDPAFARELATLVPTIRLQPVRCYTGGRVLLRAEFELKLVSLFGQLDHVEGVRQQLTVPMNVDLFDPPQPIRYRRQVLALKQQKQPNGRPLTERQIAAALGVTQPVVQRAMALERRMQELGVDDPYQAIYDPPTNYGKLRRHRHPRYRFEPVVDYEHEDRAAA